MGGQPEDSPSTPYTAGTFGGAISRMPESNAPQPGGQFYSLVTLEVDVPARAEGRLYSPGGSPAD